MGKVRTTVKLIDIVNDLSAYDEEYTIYAVEPWTCDSEAVVASEPDDGDLPPEVEGSGATYFIEVSIARDFLEDWLAYEVRLISIREQCERLIHYAIHDA